MDFVYDINNNILYYVTIITFIYHIIFTDYDYSMISSIRDIVHI